MTKFSVPGAPLNLTISDVTAVSFVVKWEEPACSFGVIKKYIVKIKYSESEVDKQCYHGDENYEFVINSQEKSVNFTHAQPYSDYKITVSAETAVGIGESVEAMVTTAEDGNNLDSYLYPIIHLNFDHGVEIFGMLLIGFPRRNK